MEITAVRVEYEPGKITSNLKEVAEQIKAAADEYRGIVITEDAVADGKKLLASLRKEKTALDDDRKRIKKAWLKPFEDWEREAKKVIALYDEPEAELKKQLDDYEADRRAAKQETIKEIYTEAAGEWSEYIPLTRIYNPKWENATYSTDQIRADVESEARKAEMMVGTIKSLRKKYEAEGLETLKRTGDMQAAIDKMTEMEDQERAIEAIRQAAVQVVQKDPEPMVADFLPLTCKADGFEAVTAEYHGDEPQVDYGGFAPAQKLRVVVTLWEDDMDSLKEWARERGAEVEF